MQMSGPARTGSKAKNHKLLLHLYKVTDYNNTGHICGIHGMLIT